LGRWGEKRVFDMLERKKTRVLFLVQLPPPLHGASTMNQSVYNAISSDSQFETRLISLNFAHDLADLQKVRFGKVVKAFTILFKLIWQLLYFRPNTVYFSMVPLNFVLIRDAVYLLIIKLLLPKGKYVLHFHLSGLIKFAERWKLKGFYQFLFRRCIVIHLTEGLVKQEIIPLKLKNTKVVVAPNWVEEIQEKDYDFKKSSNSILFFSNLIPSKGYDKVFDAFCKLAKTCHNLTLTIAGNPVRKDFFEDLLLKKNQVEFSNRIRILGSMSGKDKMQLFLESSIFVLPSEMEYFPLVVLEAMMAKTPVITTGRENLDTIFVDNESIIFLDSLEVEEIVEKLQLLIDDPGKRDLISKNAYARVRILKEESIAVIKEVLAS